MFLNIYISVW